MTKTEFTSFLAKKQGLPLPYAEKILNAFLDSVEDALFRDGRVTLKGFGTFETREVSERQGKHPLTGQAITVPAYKTVRFRPSAAIRDYLD